MQVTQHLGGGDPPPSRLKDRWGDAGSGAADAWTLCI